MLAMLAILALKLFENSIENSTSAKIKLSLVGFDLVISVLEEPTLADTDSTICQNLELWNTLMKSGTFGPNGYVP